MACPSAFGRPVKLARAVSAPGETFTPRGGLTAPARQLNVPVSLMSGERSVDLHFRMLDNRTNTPVRYERVNAETGEEVPWKEIV